MFTSRAEYRLALRQDNADRRLTPIGRRIGLVDNERWLRFESKNTEIARVHALLESTRIDGDSLAKLLRRPETTWTELTSHSPELATVPAEVARQVEYDVKYAGYIARQDVEIARLARLQEKRIPTSFDYSQIVQLRTEAREKLGRVRPVTLGQASRISGITPSDLAIVLVHLEGA
jgi:tRNA uridine 5-carboxymethylaminomethyl modification enzyme